MKQASPARRVRSNGVAKADLEHQIWMDEHRMLSPPSVYVKIDGVMTLNPEYLTWRETYQREETNDGTDTKSQTPLVDATSKHLDMHSLIQDILPITDKALLRPTMGNYVEHCSGVIILTASEYALGLSRQYGKGLLLQHFKKTNSWSLPVAIQMRGAGLGIQLGADTKAMVIFLNDHQLKTFANDAVLRMGSQIGFTISEGLEGDAYLDISDWFHIDGSSAWTDTKGWRFCISLQGNVISPLSKVNKEMYGNISHPRSKTNVTQKILLGAIKTQVSSKNNEDIKQLHQSLNTAIEKKFIPKWYVDEEDKKQETPTVA